MELNTNTCLKEGVSVAECLILSLALWAVWALQEWVLNSPCLFVLFLFSFFPLADEQRWYFSLGPGSMPVSCNCLSDICWEVAFV